MLFYQSISLNRAALEKSFPLNVVSWRYFNLYLALLYTHRTSGEPLFVGIKWPLMSTNHSQVTLIG